MHCNWGCKINSGIFLCIAGQHSAFNLIAIYNYQSMLQLLLAKLSFGAKFAHVYDGSFKKPVFFLQYWWYNFFWPQEYQFPHSFAFLLFFQFHKTHKLCMINDKKVLSIIINHNTFSIHTLAVTRFIPSHINDSWNEKWSSWYKSFSLLIYMPFFGIREQVSI